MFPNFLNIFLDVFSRNFDVSFLLRSELIDKCTTFYASALRMIYIYIRIFYVITVSGEIIERRRIIDRGVLSC